MYTITIYIAGQGTALQNGGTSNAGHMWYSLMPVPDDGTGSYGFGPLEQKDTTLPVQGDRIQDDTTNYINPAYSRTLSISEHEYNLLKEFGSDPFAHGFDSTYWAPSNSCVDFVWKALEYAGMNPGGHQGSLWPIDNRDDLQQFMELSIAEQSILTKRMNDLLPLTGSLWTPDDLLTGLQSKFTQATTTRSPLVLDLNGDGVVGTVGQDAGVYFDHDSNGFAERTGWVNAEDVLTPTEN